MRADNLNKTVQGAQLSVGLKGRNTLTGEQYTMAQRSKMISDAEKKCNGLIDEKIAGLQHQIDFLNENRPTR